MKYETKTEEDGTVVLKLGLHHEMGFAPDVDLEGILQGIGLLVNKVAGIDVFELTKAVMDEFAKAGLKPVEGGMGG